jgi:anti-anti-sigma factor
VLWLSGALDQQVTADLQAALMEIVDRTDKGRSLEVDMSAVEYVSSTGVGVLSNVLIQAVEGKTAFRVTNMKPKVESVFEVLGLLSFFKAGAGGGS